jgi:putative effector of murein hydrolase
MTIVLAVVLARKLGYNPKLFAVLGALAGIAAAHFIHIRHRQTVTLSSRNGCAIGLAAPARYNASET